MSNAVTKRDALISVLIPASGRKEDGVVFDSESDQAVPIRVLPMAVWDSFTKESRWEKFCREYGEVPRQERAELHALARLSQAIHTRSIQIYEQAGEIRAHVSHDLRNYVRLQSAARARLKVALPLDPPDFWADPELQAEALFNELLPPHGDPILHFREQLDQRIRAGHFVMWWSSRDRMLACGLFFNKVQDALFALLALQATEPQGLGICERCSKTFGRARVGQKFCSIRCGNYMRKMRERQKMKGEKS